MKLVLVDWVDSHGPHGSPWLSADEVPGLGELLECRSVGWWVGETSNPKAITLAPHRHLADDGSDSGYCGLLTIPMCAVTRIEELLPEEQKMPAPGQPRPRAFGVSPEPTGVPGP